MDQASKTIDFAEFMESVRMLGIYWLMMNQVPPEFKNPLD